MLCWPAARTFSCGGVDERPLHLRRGARSQGHAVVMVAIDRQGRRVCSTRPTQSSPPPSRRSPVCGPRIATGDADRGPHAAARPSPRNWASTSAGRGRPGAKADAIKQLQARPSGGHGWRRRQRRAGAGASPGRHCHGRGTDVAIEAPVSPWSRVICAGSCAPGVSAAPPCTCTMLSRRHEPDSTSRCPCSC